MHPLGLSSGEATVSAPRQGDSLGDSLSHADQHHRWHPGAETTTFLDTWRRKKTKPQCGKEGNVLDLHNDHSKVARFSKKKKNLVSYMSISDKQIFFQYPRKSFPVSLKFKCFVLMGEPEIVVHLPNLYSPATKCRIG